MVLLENGSNCGKAAILTMKFKKKWCRRRRYCYHLCRRRRCRCAHICPTLWSSEIFWTSLWIIQTFLMLLLHFELLCFICKCSSYTMLKFRLAANSTKRRMKRERERKRETNDTHKTNKEFEHEKKVWKHVFPLSTFMFSFFPFLLSMRCTSVYSSLLFAEPQ